MSTQKPALPVSERMDKPKKILHLIQSLDNGGCENMLLRTLPLLNEQGLENIVVTLKAEGSLAEALRARGIPVYTIHQKHLLDISSYFRLLKLIKSHQPELIVTYLLHADIVGRLVLQAPTKAKVIPFLRTTYNHPRYRLARLFEQATKSLVTHYLANSQAVKDFYTSSLGIKPDKITVIPNGIDTDSFDAIQRDENLRKSFEIQPKDTAIICVANLHPNKGHAYLLKAFEEVFEKQPNIHLLIVGDGEERQNLLDQIAHYSSKGNIHFLGRRSDVPQLLKISDIFVLPTLFEGMSNALMEAMGAGLPAIATDIPENRILIKDQKTGLLTLRKSAHDLVRLIEDLLQNKGKRGSIGREAKLFIQENFSLHATVAKTSAFLKSIKA
jgi:glycosyltransferase involved in cell wall biosynthesis